MKKYNKGSIWRKWDLHIHSEYSLENNTKMKIKDIFENAIKNNIEVISITDHSNVDGLDEVIEIYNSHKFNLNGEDLRVNEKIEYLPGVELKTDAGGKGTHIIGVFPKEINGKIVDKEFLKENFLSPLGLTKHIIEQAGNGDYSKGLLSTPVNFEDSCKKIRELNGVVIIHSGDKHGSIEKCMAHAKNQTPEEVYNSLGELKKEYMEEYIDICEVSSFKKAKSSGNFYLENFNKPTVISSDSHENYTGQKFTWIKGEPTLNGLKQILNEPYTRVILGDKPDEKISYNIIDKVRFVCNNENFSNEWIEINSDLNTIIGGKSSGKSLLLYLIAKANLKEKIQDKNIKYELEKLGIEDFEVLWKDGTKTSLKNETPIRNITYIPQLYLNNIVEKNKDELEEVILNIILEKNDLKDFHANFQDKIFNLENMIKADSEKIFSIIKKREEYENKLLNLPEQNSIEIEIEKIKKEIDILQTEAKLSKDDKIFYENLKNFIEELQKQLAEKTQELTGVDNITPKIEIMHSEIQSNYSEFKKYISNIFIREEFKTTIDSKINLIMANFEKEATALKNIIPNSKDVVKSEIEKIKLELDEKEKEIKPLQLKISGMNSIQELEKNIQKEKEKLNERKKIEQQKIESNEEIEEIKKEIENNLKTLKEEYCEMKDKFMQNKNISQSNNLELEVGIIFDKETFKERFNTRLDLRKSLDKLFEECFIDEEILYDYSSIEKILIKIFNKILNDKELKMKKGSTKFDITQELFKNYFKFTYDLKQNQDNLLSMSPGKRGLILFQLYLQFSLSEFPILVDQPEDNLDNRTVYNELKDFIIEKKIQRQIIMVTHNANLVVSTDAEEVIVANQSGEIGSNENKKYRFEYVSGALENTFSDSSQKGVLNRKGIKEHVCEILEGGEEAFKNRNKKYNIIKN